MIRAVCIDVDNTLIDFNKCAENCIKKGFDDVGLTYSRERFEVFKRVNDGLWLSLERGEITKDYLFDNRWNIVFEELGITGQDGPAFEKRFRDYIYDESIPVDGAPEMMEYLSNKYPIYIMTNGFLAQQVNRLIKIGFMKYIREIFASLEIGYNKPEKGFFDYCFARMPYKPEETLMIGDSLSSDIRGAIGMGMHTLWFNYDRREDYHDVAFDHKVDSLFEVTEIIDSLQETLTS